MQLGHQPKSTAMKTPQPFNRKGDPAAPRTVARDRHRSNNARGGTDAEKGYRREHGNLATTTMTTEAS